MKTVHKLFNTRIASINDEEKSVEFVISTDEVDRYGDVVDQESWNFKSYEANPIVLWGHDPSVPENVLGTSAEFSTYSDGKVKKTKAKITFATAINAKALMVYEMVKASVLRTVSVGFVPHTMEFEEDIPVLKDNELLEISIVPIPANAGAVALSLKDGLLHEKDARWMLDSMQKESDLLTKELENLTPKGKSMTEEQAQGLIAAIAKTNEKLDALAEENKTLREQIEALKPAEETDEQKTAREAKEAEDAAAAQKAKEDANVAAGLNPDGSAKSGTDGDQGGAEDVEFDDNTELTPEQEAALDAQLEESLAQLETAA